MDLAAIQREAMRQHGCFALRDATRYGGSAGGLARYASRHGWRHPMPGVVVLPGAPGTFQQAVMVAILAVGGPVVAGRKTAAFLWGMTRTPPETTELFVPRDRHRPRLPGVVVGDSRTLRRRDLTWVGGIPVTSPARTVVDLAPVLDVDALRNVVIDARQRRIVRLVDINAVHDSIARTPAGPKLTRVLRDLDETTCDSALEWEWRKAVRGRGLRPYPRPFPYRCRDGIVVEIDVAFPRQWVANECDGLSSRAERAHLTTHHRRQNIVVGDGWKPLLVDWTRLSSDPEGLLDELCELLARADPNRRPARPADVRDIHPRYRGRR